MWSKMLGLSDVPEILSRSGRRPKKLLKLFINKDWFRNKNMKNKGTSFLGVHLWCIHENI